MSTIQTFLCYSSVLYLISTGGSLPVDNSKPTCQNCHVLDPDRINVHIVAHSHDDVGWLQTFDDYYFGSPRNSLHNIVVKGGDHAGVRFIITTVIEALLENPDRRFIQVETAFLWRWWQDQNDDMRNKCRTLIDEGRLEIINGGWSMNDEACTHYQSIIDQYTWGFRILNDTLGQCATPKISWQVDPFGHSREHASIVNQMGFKGLVLGRIDDQEKKVRRKDRNLDFIWKTSDSLDNPYLFTTILPDFYDGIGGLCFDITCWTQDFINDNNINEKVEIFIKKLDQYEQYYKTDNFLVPIGGDFHYQNANDNFNNLDKLLAALKNHPKYNVFYSTPSCYLSAVQQQINSRSISLTPKSQDFFPYGTTGNIYWTGYFTSRPTSKRLERFSNNILQAAKQLSALSRVLYNTEYTDITPLREAMGIMQHHDAITGTAKQKVNYDYIRLLTSGIDNTVKGLSEIIDNLIRINDKSSNRLELSLCMLANVSICEISGRDKFIAVVYNPLSRDNTHYVRLPVNGEFYRITGPDGEEVYDVFDSISDFSYVTEKTRPSAKELVFAARKIPALGVKIYYLEKISDDNDNDNFADSHPYRDISSGKHFFGTDSSGFTIIDGALHSIIINDATLEVTQEFQYYTGKSSFRASGAYDFIPQYNTPQNLSPLTEIKAKSGYLVDEVVQIFNDQARQIIRVYKGRDDNYIEFDWLIGELKNNQEVITKYKFKNIFNNLTFYTDSNGREMIQRRLNYRDGFDYLAELSLPQANYYPITSKITLKDEHRKLQVSILNDRSQGGSSLKEGEIEIMLNRRTNSDDGWGVGEGLRENEYGRGIYARGQHWLTFGPIKRDYEDQLSTVETEKRIAEEKLNAPIILLGGVDDNLEDFKLSRDLKFAGLSRSLPLNVKILTFEPWRDDLYLLRLEHIFEKSDDNLLSQPVKLSLSRLFTRFCISDIGETTLGANEWWDDYNIEGKTAWHGYDNFAPFDNLNPDDPLEIVLKPMQIRTFLVRLVKCW